MLSSVILCLLLLSTFLVVSLVLELLSGTLSLSTLVEVEFAMLLTDWDQKASLGHFLDERTSNRSTDLELFAKNGSGNTKDLGDLLEHSLELLLVKVDGVVKFILDLDLSP